MSPVNLGILSGKGGVGKTSLAASLITLTKGDVRTNAVILDCDVDAPNLALIMPASDEEKIAVKDVFTSKKATFLEEKCVNCKRCVDEHFCEFGALSWDDNNQIPVIDYLSCEGCGACKVLCPEHAFSVNDVKSGEIIAYDTPELIELVYGKTVLGSTTSGKLVTEVKKFAQNTIALDESDLVIIDGPPGIGCPVIATISGLNYVVLITEPTPSGLHDLMRIIEVINQFEIPFGIIINKADIKSPFKKKIMKFIKKNKYTLLGTINFDFSIPKSMAAAMPVVKFAPESEASMSIKEIYNSLKSILRERKLI